MKRRGGKREGARQKKSPALTKITREMKQKHWRANHHYMYLENRIFSTWRKVCAEGTFVNDSKFASRLLSLEQTDEDKLRTRSIISSKGQPLVEPCFLRVEQALLQ